jgi:hypothetical protein
MGKFSDLPRFLLDDYFEESLSEGSSNSVIRTSCLHGGSASITAKGGYWTRIWIRVENTNDDGDENAYPGYIEYKFRVRDTYRTDDNFGFDYGSLVTLPASANDTFVAGSEVYFKKGSYVYEWLLKNSTLYKDYFNTNKMWMYFGKIYPISDEEDGYYIMFDGMKNFAMNALPYHQRTENLTEFMNIYFDKIYSQVYNMMKNVYSLMDAREISTDWIEYILNDFDLSVDRYLSGISLREWVQNIVYLLKRKGTYTSLYIIWKTLLKNTTNNLNIYDRWHPSVESMGTYVPLAHFVDVLHQVQYGVTPTGCSGDYWYLRAFGVAGSVIHIQESSNTIWYVYHQMYTEHIMVQCYNDSLERVWPKSITPVSKGLIEIEFETSIKGYAFLLRNGEQRYDQTSSLVQWILTHSLDSKNAFNQYQNDSSDDYTLMMPKDVTINDTTYLTADFENATDGHAMVQTTDVYKFTDSGSTWVINYGTSTLTELVFLQVYNDSDEKIQPYSITLSDVGGGTATIVFNESVSGYILVKAAEDSTTLPDDLIRSPHYKVEIDLSCQPLDDDEPPYKILSETTIDRLIEHWETMRPVTRFSHYHLLISPITDFTGNNVSLYSGGYNASLLTRYTASAGELLPVAGSDSMVFYQYSNKRIWNITHTLNIDDWIVQCYDSKNYRMWPLKIHTISTDQVEIVFQSATNGYAVFVGAIAPSGETVTQAATATTWSVSHSLASQEVMVQWDDDVNTKTMPASAVLDGIGSIDVKWNEAVSGESIIALYDYIYVRTIGATKWPMVHNLGSDSVAIQFFDSENRMMLPDEIVLDNYNQATATFTTSADGYAIIRGVNKVVTESDIMTSMVGGSWVIGNGTYGIDYEPLLNDSVESELANGSELEIDSDDDYYYITFEVNNVINNGEDWDITEALLKNSDGDPKFYSYFSSIHKPADVNMYIHFRIMRSQE